MTEFKFPPDARIRILDSPQQTMWIKTFTVLAPASDEWIGWSRFPFSRDPKRDPISEWLREENILGIAYISSGETHWTISVYSEKDAVKAKLRWSEGV